jgi:hypothetical protein
LSRTLLGERLIDSPITIVVHTIADLIRDLTTNIVEHHIQGGSIRRLVITELRVIYILSFRVTSSALSACLYRHILESLYVDPSAKTDDEYGDSLISQQPDLTDWDAPLCSRLFATPLTILLIISTTLPAISDQDSKLWVVPLG